MINQKGCQKYRYLMLLNSQHLLGWNKGQDNGYPRQKNYKYRTAIVSAVLYGCETWSDTLRDEQ